MNPAFIYGLVDPQEPNHVRYVGMAQRTSRPFAHAKEARKTCVSTHKLNWIRKIQSEGREPAILVIEELPKGTSRSFLGFVESCYVKSLREIGHALTNGTDGGDGGATRVGHRNTQGHNAAVSRALLGHGFSPDTLKKMSAAKKGTQQSEEHKQRISESMRGKKHPAILGNTNASGKRTGAALQNIRDAAQARRKAVAL